MPLSKEIPAAYRDKNQLLIQQAPFGMVGESPLVNFLRTTLKLRPFVLAEKERMEAIAGVYRDIQVRWDRRFATSKQLDA